jgi:hypothetical protein
MLIIKHGTTLKKLTNIMKFSKELPKKLYLISIILIRNRLHKVISQRLTQEILKLKMTSLMLLETTLKMMNKSNLTCLF